MEAYTFSDPAVQDALANTVWLQAERGEALANVNEPGDLERLQNRGLFE